MKQFRNIIMSFILFGSLLSLVRCSNDSTTQSKRNIDRSTYSNLTLITNKDKVITFQEFLDANGFKETHREDAYSYQGDIFISRKSVKGMYNTYVNSMNQNTTVRGYVNQGIQMFDGGTIYWQPYLWNAEEKIDLSYSFVGPLYDEEYHETSGVTQENLNIMNENRKQAFREAAKVWMKAANIVLYEVPTGGKITIKYDPDSNSPMYTFYPNEHDNSINISDKIPIPQCGYAIVDCTGTTGLFLHEIGHLLGLKHEHARTDTTDLLSSDSVVDYKAGGGLDYGTQYDSDSVMNYINNGSQSNFYQFNFEQTGEWLSPGDIEIIQILYGPPVTSYASPCDMPKGLTGGVKVTCCDESCSQ